MELTEDQYLAHYGVLRRSGRYKYGSGDNVEEKEYPWASGRTQAQRNKTFLDVIAEHRAAGMKDVDIARGYGMSTTQLRAAKSIAKSEQKQSQITQAQALKNKGFSNGAIGQRMGGLNESSVRALLADGAADKSNILNTTSNMLKDQVDKRGFIDIGTGVEHHIGVSSTMLNNSVAVLKEKGYEVHTVPVEQLGTGNKTNVKVLAPPGTTWGDVRRGQSEIKSITQFSQDGGRTTLGIKPPMSINPKRIDIKYAEDGGSKADGILYVRPGVKDVEIGGSSYAQVRMQVGKGHYLKGMAMYKDDLPEGVDIQFNTNKSNTGNKLDVMKELKKNPDGSIDTDNPFGSNIKRQIISKDSKGNEKLTSAMNLVNEEGNWADWSKTISSQMLSKQTPALAKQQLDLTYKQRIQEYNKISSLTNPAVRKKLLEEFGDEASSAAVHLKAAAIPRTFGHHVILPIPSMKPNEVYAPNYRDGETVVLIRHPHGGTFEIPELTVNNKQKDAKKLIGANARDAVGIHHSVAERLSGADFDGDTVLVIPNNTGRVKTTPALEGLKNFDPRAEYPPYPGMKPMSATAKQQQMGDITNLINDMTIKKASTPELARAVRHSMVVIDAEKHNLNYKESSARNGIKQLKEKYQGGPRAGASTLISRAGSEERIPEQKPRAQSRGGPIDKETGKRVFEPTGEGFTTPQGKYKGRTTSVEKLANTDDARTLLSGPKNEGTPIERVYADHSNRLKDLGNKARLESVNTPKHTYSPSAAKTYAPEVSSLAAKLKIAQRNAPLERQAQVFAGTVYRQKLDANPDMDDDTKKKIRFQALNEARNRTGAGKERIEVSSKEWDAIQAGAVTPSRLKDIIDNADMDIIREHATPRTSKLMSPAKVKQAAALFANGATRAEVADRLGVSLSTLDEAVNG